jgi:hypothetical protein
LRSIVAVADCGRRLRSPIAPSPLRGQAAGACVLRETAQPAGTAAALTLKPGSAKVRNGPMGAAASYAFDRESVV